jgi:hypothetical protein
VLKHTCSLFLFVFLSGRRIFTSVVTNLLVALPLFLIENMVNIILQQSLNFKCMHYSRLFYFQSLYRLGCTIIYSVFVCAHMYWKPYSVLTYLWSWALTEKLPVVQPFRKFPVTIYHKGAWRQTFQVYYGDDKLLCGRGRAKTVVIDYLEETVKYWVVWNYRNASPFLLSSCMEVSLGDMGDWWVKDFWYIYCKFSPVAFYEIFPSFLGRKHFLLSTDVGDGMLVILLNLSHLLFITNYV